MGHRKRWVRSVGVIAGVATVIRVVSGFAPVAAVVLVGVVAVVAAVYGVWTTGRHRDGGWRAAWSALGLGLVCAVASAVAGALGGPGAPADPPLVVILSLGGGVLAIVGLVWLIVQRLPGRASEALAEAVLGAAALGLLVTAMIIVPAHGWHPGRDLSAMVVPLVDLVALWLAASLISLTERHPAGYRYLVAGLACLFAVSATDFLLVTSARSASPALDTVAMWGAFLWAIALVHRSHRVPFEPVPARSTRPSAAHVATLLVCAVVVPAALTIRFVTDGARQPGLVLAALALPLAIVAFLLHKVFAHAAAEYRAQHDPLTGICNRILFEDRVHSALTQARRSDSAVGVMFLDLDRFKSINDSLGHAVGNQVLQAVVKRLQSCLRTNDTVARMGGDEFTLLLPDIGDKDQCARFAERTLAVFSDPFTIGGRQLTVQASAGIALFPDDGSDADSLLKNADTAMYQAKAAGRNTFEVYDSAMSVRAKLRFALEASLRSAVETGRLAVHYQPKYDTETGEISGAEALARWYHPRLGFIPPWAFVPLAEESSLVETMGEWVLETVCHQARQWRDDGVLHFPIAVNMSARQIARPSVVSMVAGVLERSGLDPAMLEIEVTESVLVEQMSDVTETLSALRATGIRCSIDDFGTGYSALTYLAEFPVDEIKIDRSFVSRIGVDRSAGAIVGAVIALAHSLGLQVVGEGVETEAQYRFLKENGCDQIQGFLFSPAVPADEFALLALGPADLRASALFEGEETCPLMSVFPEERLAVVLDAMEHSRARPGEFDLEAIESILTILQRDDFVGLKDGRAFGSLPGRFAIGTLAGLTTMAGGLTAAGAITPASQRLAVDVLETGIGVHVEPHRVATSTPTVPPAPTATPDAGSPGGPVPGLGARTGSLFVSIGPAPGAGGSPSLPIPYGNGTGAGAGTAGVGSAGSGFGGPVDPVPPAHAGTGSGIGNVPDSGGAPAAGAAGGAGGGNGAVGSPGSSGGNGGPSGGPGHGQGAGGGSGAGAGPGPSGSAGARPGTTKVGAGWPGTTTATTNVGAGWPGATTNVGAGWPGATTNVGAGWPGTSGANGAGTSAPSGLVAGSGATSGVLSGHGPDHAGRDKRDQGPGGTRP